MSSSQPKFHSGGTTNPYLTGGHSGLKNPLPSARSGAGQFQTTSILESQVKEVITSAKSKIQDLQREIEMLNQEYDQVTAQLESAHGQRKEVVDRNRSLQDQLKLVKLENEELARRKVELT